MKVSARKSCIILIVIVALSHPRQGLRACDTWVALPDATSSGCTLLGKNSDRTNFDCQPLFLHPRAQWPAGSQIDLGRITIPQVEETFATLGSSPYWCWGYEEGINEHSVAIGNEGIRNKVFAELLAAQARGEEPAPGPTGMDLIRLGLERGKTAGEALDAITRLVEQYGQFGSGLPSLPAALGGYDNSYIIADSREAWVLETAGNHWVARRISRGTTSISNTLSIERDFDLTSEGLVSYAVKKGWWPSDKATAFDFTKAYLDDSPTGSGQRMLSLPRARCSSALLSDKEGNITLRWMMGIARDRTSEPTIDRDNTASSCVAVLPTGDDRIPVFWWCPSVPSNSCYIPFFVHGKELPKWVSQAGTFGRKITPPSQAVPDQFSEDSFWWRFRDLSDKVRESYSKRNAVVRAAFDLLEKEFEAELPGVTGRALSLRKQGRMDEAAGALDAFTAACFNQVLKKVDALRRRFEEEVVEVPEKYKPYVGKYLANFGPFKDVEYTVLMQNDRLAVDVPGQRIYELKDPDAEGKWYFVLTDQIAVSFDRNDSNQVNGMSLYQAGFTFTLPRIADKK